MARSPVITRLGQLAASGEWNMRREPLLAEQIAKGPHDFVLDLGSGRSPLLQHIAPARYAGLDLGGADLAYASERFAREGYEFVEGDFMRTSLEPWRGADVVAASAVFHHLTDDQVVELLARIRDEVAPGRMVFTDGVAKGPLAGTLIRLDEGEPSREPEELYDLFRPEFEVSETWRYVVPLRTYLYFGFELTPRG